MCPPSIDDAEFSRVLREQNRRAQDPHGRPDPFPNNPGLSEAWRRGYIDEKGDPK
ncbi:hypothetical protein MSS2_03470 [Mycobacterium marinum]|nr:hypothetical protein MSS2_03470 [Mycobacterium marinum]